MSSPFAQPTGPSRAGLESVLWPGGDGWLYRLDGAAADFINHHSAGRMMQAKQAGKDEVAAVKVSVDTILSLTRLWGVQEGRDPFAELINN